VTEEQQKQNNFERAMFEDFVKMVEYKIDTIKHKNKYKNERTELFYQWWVAGARYAVEMNRYATNMEKVKS
jgi:hypothetical protein